MSLTPKQEAFCQAIIAGKSQSDAYRAAYSTKGMKASTIHVRASELASDSKVAVRLAELREKRAERTNIDSDQALQQVWAIATADPRELMEWRVGCCRYCWGKDNRYQRTVAELERDMEAHEKVVEAAIASNKPFAEFDEKGGIGYDRRRAPNPQCQECFGEGEGRAIIHDTSRISPGAAALFAGIKETKDGVEIKLHHKGEALDKVFRHLGLYEKDNKQRSPLDGVPRDTLKAIAERLRGQG